MASPPRRINKAYYPTLYLEHDKYAIFNNNDKDLQPVRIKLPEPPNPKLIDGYGYHPLDQKFTRHEIPGTLTALEKEATENVQNDGTKTKVNSYKVAKEFWKLLSERQDNYQDEIAYLKKIHWHMRYGYWFYCKGKPTWLTPWHYRYLNFWHIDVPDNHYRAFYRDVDRRTFIFKWYSYTTHETFAKMDDRGVAIPEKDGSYEMVELSHRTLIGTIKPKRRREGATNQEFNNLRWIFDKGHNHHCTVFAETGTEAEKLYKEIFIPAWNHEPIFMKPVNNVTDAIPKTVKLVPPNMEYGETGLEGIFDYPESGGERGTDKRKMYGILMDEAGKTEYNVMKRHDRSRESCKQAMEIFGYMSYPSTVEDMNKGGAVYEKLWNASNFYKRLPNGQTHSGLIRLFMPAEDGLEGFIDPWGYSVIETPTEEQIEANPDAVYSRERMGSKEYLDREDHSLIGSGTPEEQQAYRSARRKFPRKVEQCWWGVSGDLGFDTIILDKRVSELKRDSRHVLRGNFFWNDPVKMDKVVFAESPDGRFFISNKYDDRSSQWEVGPPVIMEGKGPIPARKPTTPGYTVAGADSFRFGTEQEAKRRAGVRMSDGGFCVYLRDDPATDTKGKFICSYRYRPPSWEDYAEDVLLASVYFNAMLCIESNVENLWPYFIDKGFGGYLLYLLGADGRVKSKPGVYNLEGSKQMGFNFIRDYIKKKGLEEDHILLLEECRSIRGPEYLTDYDMLASAMMALMGDAQGYWGYQQMSTGQAIDISGTFMSRKSF